MQDFMISRSADYQDMFIRERTDGIELEYTKPIESWGKSALQGLGLVVFMAFVIWVF